MNGKQRAASDFFITAHYRIRQNSRFDTRLGKLVDDPLNKTKKVLDRKYGTSESP